jgi:hypothetical protein
MKNVRVYCHYVLMEGKHHWKGKAISCDLRRQAMVEVL